MTVDRSIRVFAGANLLRFGFSQVRPLGMMLRRLGMPQTVAGSSR